MVAGVDVQLVRDCCGAYYGAPCRRPNFWLSGADHTASALLRMQEIRD
jgi:hypothetical protein